MASNQGEIQANPLRMGITGTEELEEKIKAFRTINGSAIKKRYLLSRQKLTDQSGQELLLEPGTEIDMAKAKQIRRFYHGSMELKTYQPDEGISVVSDLSSPEGAPLTMEIMHSLSTLGGGRYESFIDRVDTFSELLQLIKKSLFPRMVIVGYFPHDRLRMERVNMIRLRRYDTFMRFLEVTHSEWKHSAGFPSIKQVRINPGDPEAGWDSFLNVVCREYQKPYYVEEM